MLVLRALLRTAATLLAFVVSFPALGQALTYTPVEGIPSTQLSALKRQVDAGDTGAVYEFWRHVEKSGTPILEAVPEDDQFDLVTFIWHGDAQTRNVVIFDGVAGFDAKDRVVVLPGTNVWFKTYRVRRDARSPTTCRQTIRCKPSMT